ncbi:MAG: PrsW family intramembrane metalloprotease [Deltaproteobacteria bacterium]|nr:PrsW family intramembrane metalloprotease [Candidatus Zymogenaceae bacterium]
MALFVELFVVSTAPGFFILWFVYHVLSAGRREATLPILLTFLLGCAVVVPAALIEGIAVPHIQNIVAGTIPRALAIAFCVVAPTEELSRFLALVPDLRRPNSISTSRDGVMYGVAAAMGFATAENILFVMELGFTAGLFRAFLSVPVHGICGAAIGYALGVGAKRREGRVCITLAGLGAAMLFHGIFDGILLIQAG